MSDKIKEKIGEELYNKVLDAGLKATEFDLIDGYVPRSRLNEVNDKLKVSNEANKTYEQKLKDTEKMLSDNKEFKTKYTSLSEKYEKDLAGKDEENLKITKKYRVENALLKEGAKHINMLSKEIDFSKISVEGDNTLGLNDSIKELKKSYPDFFTTKTVNTNTGIKNKDKNEGGGNENPDEIDWDKKLSHLVK